MAIKILTAEATFVQGRVADELGILQRITSHAQTSAHPGRPHVVTVQDTFLLESADKPRANHLCLVQVAYRVFERINSRLLEGDVKRFAYQMLLALDFLNRECDIIHTGMI